MKPKKTKIKIVLGQTAFDSHVYINDVEVPAMSVEIKVDANAKDPLTKVKLELFTENVYLEGEYIKKRKKKAKL